MTYSLEITRPLLLLGLLSLVVVWWAYRRSLVDFSPVQRRVSTMVRTLVLLLIVLAASGLNLLYPTARKFVVFLVDRSTSVGERSEQELKKRLAELDSSAEDNAYGFLNFATVPESFRSENRMTRLSPKQRQGTNYVEALNVAKASVPAYYVPEFVLLTDGNETAGDVRAAAASSIVPISTIPIATGEDAEVQVASLRLPAQVQRGARFEFSATVDSSVAGRATVTVYLGPHKLRSEERILKRGENILRFQMDATFELQERVTVVVESAGDTLLDNNQASGIVFVSGEQRVLLIDADRRARANLVSALQQHEIQVTDDSPEFFPETLAELQKYQAVILSNVPANQLSPDKMQNLRTYVEELGGGLIMLGGDQSFGLGGYYKSVLEAVLPVRSDFEKEREKPSLAMVIIIDKSGSMGGQKLEMAKDAAKSAVELLGPRDQVGVIAFDGTSQWISEIHSAGDRGYILKRIGTIRPGGGTNMHPAMEDALQGLTNSVAKLKHVIVLSDGHSSPGDFEGVTTRMANGRITVSTVAVGAKADRQLFQNLARLGNGRYYRCDDPRSIPQIFAKETVTASKSAINEVPFIPKPLMRTKVLSNLDLEATPMLMGYVATKPKRTSQQILVTETGDPLLSWWRYGLGMSVAFTSDASSRWADEWLSSEEFYSNFWAQVVRHAMRKDDSKGVYIDLQRDGGQTTVSLDSVDPNGVYRNGLKTSATVLFSSTESQSNVERQDITMSQVAPGKYQAQFDNRRAGVYQVLVTQRNVEGQVIARQTRGLVTGYPEELRLKPTNKELLQDVARLSKGRFDPTLEQVFADNGRRAARVLPLWRLLVISAMVLFVIDVALRRIEFWRTLNSTSQGDMGVAEDFS